MGNAYHDVHLCEDSVRGRVWREIAEYLWRLVPRRTAMSWLSQPSAAKSTIFARRMSRAGVQRPRAQRVNWLRSWSWSVKVGQSAGDLLLSRER